MTPKQQVLDIVAKMPDDSTLDDIGYELYVVQSIRQGLGELDRGEYLSHQAARGELGRWLMT